MSAAAGESGEDNLRPPIVAEIESRRGDVGRLVAVGPALCEKAVEAQTGTER
jgi:hypothetical protein